MDFQLSEEQTLLADSVENWLRKEYDFERWRKLVKTDLGYRAENWAFMAELGWLAGALPEDFSGIGGGAVENLLIGERFGKHLVADPFYSILFSGPRLYGATSRARPSKNG